MSVSEESRRIAYGIIRHLQSQITSGLLDEDGKEGIEVSVQCISQAYGIDVETDENLPQYGGDPTLEELYSSLKKKEEAKKEAEACKQKGNVHLKFERYTEAVECYTQAIGIDPDNATYFCNRAAAYIKIQKFDQARDDCKAALSLNPSYARAYGRLGYIYSSQNKFELSKEAFEKALELDPENDSYRTNLTTVEEQLAPPPPSDPLGGAAGVGGGEGEGGDTSTADPTGGPGFGGLLGMMQNPGFMNMATSLMQTPAFQNMASQMMSQGAMPNLSSLSPDMMSGVSDAARELQRNNPQGFDDIQQHILQGLNPQGEPQDTNESSPPQKDQEPSPNEKKD